MAVTIESTTDSEEAVTAALGGLAKESEVEKSAPAEKADETTEESEASEESHDEEADSEESEESQDESDEDETKEGKKPKKNGFKKRIDKLNRRVSEKEQEAEYWRQEALKAKGQKAEPVEEPKKPATEGKPKAQDFDSDEEYIDALTDWKIEQREKAQESKQREEQVKTSYQRQVEAHQQRINEFKKSAPDFDEAYQEFIEDHPNVSVSPALEQSIYESENGPAIVYELFKNPKEFERINSMGALAIAREVGKIEARLAKSESAQIQNKQTKAPPPLKPVGSKSSKVIKSPDDMNYQEYKKWREANS